MVIESNFALEACTKKGIYANNIERFVLDQVTIAGQDGEAIVLENIDKQSIKE